ncbi:uncharacterized protein AMSG_02769 [Thecamonas trahens ATCC 50062]|uniref:Uncharacterized protein n=1 Tax=Thecamonas trahens ATCC 50062 TaxID=461836 RepID=A0A0L0D4T4_THETB|nr:hypothetical protein AMSG_02769 [Thecamonas trahens ATCC 50062]KNC46318.1 hypothetical protein AMSG_02769 [Thecamonas trahens ATCC 50062]|eukprot:XP_013760611.1 hypothetical protein AMSG_02769 [Thecamonas trahens ATCC 50062]
MGSFLSVMFGTEDQPPPEEGVGETVHFDNNDFAGGDRRRRADAVGGGGVVDSLARALTKSVPAADAVSVFGGQRLCFGDYSESVSGDRAWTRFGLRLLFFRPPGVFVLKLWSATKDGDGATLADDQLVVTGRWTAGRGQTLELISDAVRIRRYVAPGYAQYASSRAVFPPIDPPASLTRRALATHGGAWELHPQGISALRTSNIVLSAQYELTPAPVPTLAAIVVAKNQPPVWIRGLLFQAFDPELPLAAEWPSISPFDDMDIAGVVREPLPYRTGPGRDVDRYTTALDDGSETRSDDSDGVGMFPILPDYENGSDSAESRS